MLRTAFAFALLACATVVSGMETPLTLTNGNKVVVIDPVFGSISTYNVQTSNSSRLGLGRPAGNFVNDIDILLKTPVPDRTEGPPVFLIRTGTAASIKPTYPEFFQPKNKYLSDTPTPREVAAGKAALNLRAYKAEEAFWKGKVAYDGVVRASLSSTGKYLGLAIPSLHALLVYTLDSDAATLTAVTNWGPALFMLGMNTAPDPSTWLTQMPPAKRKEAYAALGIEDKDAPKPAGGIAPPAGGVAGAEEPPTPKSEVWMGAGPSDSFIIVDTANSRAILYQMNKVLTLNAVRNLAADLVVPGLTGGAINSTPYGEEQFKLWLTARKQYVQAYDLPTDLDGLLALVQQFQGKAGGKASEFEAVISGGNVAFLNFIKSRVFLTIDASDGARLNLVSARDTSIDTAMALMDQEINDRNAARNQLPTVVASVGQPKIALLYLRFVLSLDPALWKDADAKLKSSFKGELKAEYQAIIDEAKAKADELAKAADERKKAAEERRKQRAQAAP